MDWGKKWLISLTIDDKCQCILIHQHLDFIICSIGPWKVNHKLVNNCDAEVSSYLCFNISPSYMSLFSYIFYLLAVVLPLYLFLNFDFDKFFSNIEGFHVTSQQPNRASQAIHSRHVGSFFALSGIGKSHKICSHSLLLNLHKAKLHRSNNVINRPIYSLTASLTCSNKISKKLKHILLFFPGFYYTVPRKKISNMVLARSVHGVRTASWKPSIETIQTPLH